ncbi:MAG: hypothetical protein SFX73_12335 [Kofleriaceae bacterium]|nr:hypothetical protein [Kofleriaceae bacterium]
MRTPLLAVLLATATTACVTDDVEVTELTAPADGKADGYAAATFHVSTDQPYERYTFMCKEWFSCDVWVKVEGPVDGLRDTFRAYFLAHPETETLRVQAYEVLLDEMELDQPAKLSIEVCGYYLREIDIVELNPCDPFPGRELPLTGVKQVRFQNPSAMVDMTVQLAQPLRDLAASVQQRAWIGGTLKARWW